MFLIYRFFPLSTHQEHKGQLKGTKLFFFETNLRRKFISDELTLSKALPE